MLELWGSSSRRNRLIAHVSCVLALLLCAPLAASAQYAQRYSTISPGAVTFTGNSLGLDGATGQNGQGTRGGIATFITTDTTLRDITPAPTTAPPYPFGTTSNWQQNRSTAQLRMPAEARVLRAELIWGGSFADESFEGNVAAFRDTPVSFTTPSGTFSVAPDPATARNFGTLEGTRCAGARECYYVRTADVTALVAASGAGTYATGGVPATQSTGDPNRPSAGWTLAVVYEDFDQPIRNLSLFLGFEKGTQGSAAASVSGFCTPPSGPLSGRLAVTALEGDPGTTGDSMMFGPTSPLTLAANTVQGPRNPTNNFFASQILDDTGNLDIAGTFGTRNHTPGSPSVGARHGWDITNVDVSARLRNNQTSAFAQGTTNGDGYWIMALALQIDIGAPHFPSQGTLTVNRATAAVGDVLTYTAVVDNATGTTNANNVVFYDTLSPGTSFVPNSFAVNGVTQPGANPVAGVPLGTVAAGTARTITFQVRIDSIASTDQRTNRAHWTFDFVSCSGQPAQPGETETNLAVTVVPVADLTITKTLLSTPAIAGAPVSYRIVARNNGPSLANGTLVVDPGTTPALVNQTWTCQGGPLGSTCPASGSGPINTAVNLVPQGMVTFTLTGTLPAGTAPGTLVNSATVTSPANVPDFDPANNTTSVSAPIAKSADLSVITTGPATASRGGNVTYTIVVTNRGPSDAANVVVTNPAPAGLTLVTPLAGPCSAAPGCAIAAGATQTLSVTFGIPPAYAGPDPITNVASALDAAVPDPQPANNTDEATTALDAPVVDLALTKTNGVTEVIAGQSTTYTITVTNAGPAAAPGSRVVDQFDASTFDVTNVQWQCTASGSSSCGAASGTGNLDTLVDVFPGAGNEVVFTVQAPVLSTVPGGESDPAGIVTNTASVTAAATIGEGQTANNNATDTDAARTVADLSFAKTGPATIVPGTTVDYTVTVTNGGPSVARNVVFFDAPEEGAVVGAGRPRPELIQSVQAPPGSSCQNELVFDSVTSQIVSIPVCTIPLLEAGASRTFTVRMAIPPDFQVSAGPAAITNVAQLISADIDTDPDTNDFTASVTSTIAKQVDIAVTKTGPAAVVAGNAISYFVDVSNNGPSSWSDVRALDALPAGLTVVGGDGPCVTAFSTGAVCSIGALAVGQHSTTRLDLIVPADYTGPSTITNTVVALPQALPPSEEPDVSNNQAAVSTLVVPDHADVGITLSGPASVAPGGTIEYTAIVTNFGPGPAFHVTSSDVIPAGTVLVNGTIPPGPTTCTLPTQDATSLVSCLTEVLQVGQSLEFHFTLRVDADAVPGSLLTNLATVSSTTPGHNPANNQAVLVTRVTGTTEAGLSIEKTDTPDPVVVGANVTYTLTVHSQGPATATNVIVTDTLPPQLTLVSASASQGTCTGTTCNVGSVAPYGTATVTVIATATAPGVFTNTATVTATEPDPILANNTVSQVTTAATADEADLRIEKIGPTLERPGDTSFYSIRVTNRGPAVATSVQVTDTLPTGLIFVGNTGACITAFPCELEHLEPGQSVTISTAFTVDPALPTPATITNTASVVSTTTPDPDPTNNTSTVSMSIEAVGAADLVVTKVDSPDAVVAGTMISYALTVLNRGPDVAPNVVMTDVLPAGVTLISVLPTQGTCAGTTTLTCTIGSMAPGTVVEVAILATAPTSAGVMSNTATAGSSVPDPDPGNNTTTEDTTILPPSADLSIGKVLVTAPTPGLAATYRIIVGSAGPSAIVSGAPLVDALPAALQGVTWTCSATPGSTCPAASGSGGLPATGDLVEDGALTFLVSGTIASGATGVLSNTATIGVPPGGAIDPDTTNNVATSTVTLTPSADLQLSKSGPVRATPGTTVTYTLAVTNAGPSDAVDVTLNDALPAGLTFVSGGGACASYPCALGTITAGTTISATATFAVPAGYTTPDPIVNTATVSSASTPDPAAGNNTATAMSAIAAPVTDLAITKTNGVSTVVPGGTTTYTITVTNAGPSNAVGAIVSDVFPAAITNVTWTCAGASGGTCAAPSGSGAIATTVNVPAGGSVAFTALASIAADAVGVLVNTASVMPGPGQSDPSSANNTDSDGLVPQADLAIAKSGPASAAAGQSLVYTIVVTNNGPSNAEHVQVSDPTPTGLDFVSNTGACATAFPCDLGTIPVGASRTITATFSLPTALGVPLPIANVATVSSTTEDTNPANDTARVETALNREADVAVTKSVSPATVLVGETVTITVAARNNGPNPATAVEITDVLPAGLQFVSATATAGTYDAVTGAWAVGDLALGAVAQLTISAMVTSPGAITNLAVKTGEAEPDSNTANDSAAATTNAAPSADLAIQKTVDHPDALVGSTVTFSVTVTNRGPSASTGVSVADVLPAGLTFVSATPSQGTYDSSTGTWTIGSLPVDAQATLSLSATVDVPGALSNNSAVASPDQADANPLNDRSTATVNAVPNADLQVAKAVSQTAPAVGADVTYTVAVTNLGPNAVTSAEVTDLLPAGVTFVSATPSQGAYDAATGLWTVGALAVTATETLAIVGHVTQVGTIANTATRQDSAPIDPNPPNDSASASMTASIVADLAIVKTPASPTVAAGGPVTWTIVVTNLGPSAAAAAPVSDGFPAAITNVQWTCSPSSGAACGQAAGTGAIATTVDLPTSATATFVATGTVDPAAIGPLDNVAAVAAPAGASDPLPTNNTSHGPVQVTAAADVAITGSGPASALPGTTATYTFVVVNLGPSVAAAASVDVETPAGLTLASVSGACGALPCPLGALAPGESRTITIGYALPPTYETPNPFAVTAIVSDVSDPNELNNSATVATTVTPRADLAIVKQGPPTIQRGGTVTYLLTVTNAGPTAAAAVTVNDPTPGGLTFVGASAPCTGGFPCNLGTMAAGASTTVTATFQVPAGYSGPASIANTASVSTTTFDPRADNNSSTVTAPVLDVADIQVTKTVDRAAPAVGEEVTFTIAARNMGPHDATGITLTDAMPAGIQVIDATPSQGAYDAATGVWTVGALASAASATLRLRGRVVMAGSSINLVTKTGGDQLDPDPSNNSAAAALTAVLVADVQIAKIASVTNASPGSPVTFTITARNAGPSAATGVRVLEMLPDGLAFVSAAPSAGTFDPATGVWTIGALPADASASVTVSAIVMSAGPITNTAQKIGQEEMDPNTANDEAGVTINGTSADLQIVKTMSATDGIVLGRELTFFVTASNNGPSATSDVRVRDMLPPGLAFVAATATRGAYVPETGVWEIGALDVAGPGATAVLSMRAIVTSVDSITNVASVMRSDVSDPNPLNNSSAVVFTGASLDLAAGITTTDDPGRVGSTVTFTLSATNVGNVTSVEPITIAVPLPMEYAYVPESTQQSSPTFAAASAGWTCSLVGRTLFCRTAASLAPAAQLTLPVRVHVDAALPWGRALFAHLTTRPDVNPRNNVAQVYIGPPPHPDPDMSVTQSVAVSGTGATRTLTYTIDVTNQGPIAAEQAVLTDVLPEGVTLVSADLPSGPCAVAERFMTCPIGAMLPGHHLFGTIVLAAPAPGVVIHTLSTSSEGHDMYPRDNQAVLVTTLDLPADRDTDGDGMPDAWESLMGLSIVAADADGDPDGDGVSNLEEYRRGTHPRGFFRQYFAEGVSSDFFTTQFGALNPDATQGASALFEYMTDGGRLVSEPALLAPLNRVTRDPYRTLGSVNQVYSAVIESDRPLAADRTVSWGTPSYGAHAEIGLSMPSTTWYFAEGATGPFALFFLLENPNATAANATVTLLMTSGVPMSVPVAIAPFSRYTLPVNSVPGLSTGAMSTVVTSDVPIVAERAMYFGPSFLGGTDGAGAAALSTHWFFAEGATGSFFEEFVLIANPGSAAAEITAVFARPDGQTVTRTYIAAPRSRFTILVDGVDPLLANTAVAVTLTSTNGVPVVAERAMYWPGGAWQEGHVSLGSTATGLAWAIPTGTVGGPQGAKTYVLIANASAVAGTTRITLVFDDGQRVSRTIDLPGQARYTLDVDAAFPEARGRTFSSLVESLGVTPVPLVVETSRYWSTADTFWAAGTSTLAVKVR